MTTPVRAIYENGHLRLLDPVDLEEGEKIDIAILSHHDRLRDVLGDLLIQIPEPAATDSDEALQREVNAGFQGVTLSDVIIEERREGR